MRPKLNLLQELKKMELSPEDPLPPKLTETTNLVSISQPREQHDHVKERDSLNTSKNVLMNSTINQNYNP